MNGAMKRIDKAYDIARLEKANRVNLYYEEDILVELVQDLMLDIIGSEIDIHLDKDLLEEGGIYFIDIYSFSSLDKEVQEKVTKEFGNPDESLFVFSRNIIGALFNQYGEGGDGQSFVGYTGYGEYVFPITFSPDGYNKFLKDIMSGKSIYKKTGKTERTF